MDGAKAARTLELRRGERSPAMPADVQKVAEGFDQLFAGTLVSELMKPLQGAGFGGSGPGASVIQGMLETSLSEQLSKGHGLGVGRMVAKHLQKFLASSQRADADAAAAIKVKQEEGAR
ncbi:MAG: hypothetical protein EXS13_07030 [Planctomycetes bacterium]|nr:hypothetical protein [Planctomycetota bacterium]